ncbi:glycosyltransferase [Burkholderia sp. AU28942]|uniref:glycosyltransferase n=1 Tax=Burkholderia TaxID=32008 RepID=UPI00142E41FF|nr:MULTISPECIES: glycosyltransferase [Burkholderia]MCA8307013.1 glycosyltransferase [Burkholderia sp. AU28942]
MDFTGERFVPGVPGEIEMEHYHRYYLVSEIIKGKDVLDIACGEGYGSALMASDARSVIGVDIDSTAVEHARAYYRRPNLRFETGSAAAIPLPDRSVDVVVSFETIEHHDQHEEMMSEISRVLRENGILIISSPDKYEYSEKPGYRNPYHVKELYLDEFKDLLSRHFSNVDLYGQRAAFGSLIARMNGCVSKVGRHFWTRTGTEAVGVQHAELPREPVYFIALASNGPVPEFAPSMFEVEGYIESRVQGVSADYQAEIQRIALERDGMLRDKDLAWEKYLQQVVKDYGAEIERIAAERDAMLKNKDAEWDRKVEGVTQEYRAKISAIERERSRVATEVDSMHSQLAENAAFKDMVPLVSLIVVNFNGLRFLPGLLQSLMHLDYPRYEIVLVDNASSDASVDYVAEHFPSVRIVKSSENLGFAGGNNLGMQAANGDLIGLINNDTEVDPKCLRELVAALARDPKAWAAGSKLVFFRKYVEIVIKSDVFKPSERGQSSDQRELGLLLDESSAFVGCDYRKPIFADGFWGSEQLSGRRVRWTSGEARLLLPVMPTADSEDVYELSLIVSGTEAGSGASFSVELGGTQIGHGVLSSEFDEHLLRIPGSLVSAANFDLLNNAGTRLNESGDASDRGIYEPDRGQYDREESVEALCGAAMLIRRSALERIGLFDSRFFMYYEDADLCWRMRRAGGVLRYVPTSVVRHIHTGSSVEWSPMFVYYVSRNHVLIRFKHAALRVAMASYLVEAARCARACVAWMRNAIRGGNDQRARAEFGLRLRLQIDLIKKIPGTLLRRWGFKGTPLDRL